MDNLQKSTNELVSVHSLPESYLICPKSPQKPLTQNSLFFRVLRQNFSIFIEHMTYGQLSEINQ